MMDKKADWIWIKDNSAKHIFLCVETANNMMVGLVFFFLGVPVGSTEFCEVSVRNLSF